MSVRWAVGTDEAVVRAVLGIGAVDHSCPRCGANDHGVPTAAGFAGVSLSRSAGLVALATSSSGPVGIDLEPIGTPVPRGVAAHPSETADALTLWVRKEAVLKATGSGLEVAPESFWIDERGRPSSLSAYDGPPLIVHDVDVPGQVAAIATIVGVSPERAVPLR